MIPYVFSGARGTIHTRLSQAVVWCMGFSLAALLDGSVLAAPATLKPWAARSEPTLTLDRLDGPAMSLAELRGKPVIVHFFATWCAPCIEEIASLNALASAWPDAPAIVVVSVGEIDARVRNFFRDRPPAFVVLMDRDRAAMTTWKVAGLPTSFVLDRHLSSVFVAEEAVDWASPLVVEALKNHVP